MVRLDAAFRAIQPSQQRQVAATVPGVQTLALAAMHCVTFAVQALGALAGLPSAHLLDCPPACSQRMAASPGAWMLLICKP